MHSNSGESKNQPDICTPSHTHTYSKHLESPLHFVKTWMRKATQPNTPPSSQWQWQDPVYWVNSGCEEKKK